MNLFTKTLRRENDSGTPPIWFMRQAGRYHSHYQNLRKSNSFIDVCRKPDVSAEAAMGPVEDFDFDAAILFSDILFPLEAMGVPLAFNPGPQLGRLLSSAADLKHYVPTDDPHGFFSFQADALKLLRTRLPAEKGMIGFVGGPLTIYQFAVAGSGKGDGPVEGLEDGRFTGFMEKLIPMLTVNMLTQARAGVDVMAILDTSAGRLTPDQYWDHYLPHLTRLICGFKAMLPHVPVLYYSKGTGPDYWRSLRGLPLDGLGVDHHQNLAEVLDAYGEDYAIQGNIPPEWMALPEAELIAKLTPVFESVKKLPAVKKRGWICGLGHGITPDGREENVRAFIRLAREIFR